MLLAECLQKLLAKALGEQAWLKIGSDGRLAEHNLQLPAHASKNKPPYLFLLDFLQDLDSSTAVLMLP
eukprot:1158662-Pelagomonas_calceolata.AAC.3